MLDAISMSTLGLQAQKAQLDTAAANFANVNTTAYKRQSVDFSAMLDRSLLSRTDALPGQAPPAGAGRLSTFDLSQGELRQTGRALDVALSGPGFIEVEIADNDRNGSTAGYSRGGSLQVNGDGVLTLAGGQPLRGDIRVPRGATSVQILADGSVTALQTGDRREAVIGRIELVMVPNSAQLSYRGDGVFVAGEGAEVSRVRPGEDGAASLRVGSLETSNVRLGDEMVGLLLTQRIYELNTKVIQAADEMMGLANNIRRA